MLVLNLTRRWFDAIRHGGKRTEYRAATPYWAARLERLGDGSKILFRPGYARSEEDLLARVVSVDVGPCPYPGWDGDYFRIRFVLDGDGPAPKDPTRYYPGYGVDDLNLTDYLDQQEEWRSMFGDSTEFADEEHEDFEDEDAPFNDR